MLSRRPLKDHELKLSIQHGRRIFIYIQNRTNQVVYSLTRVLQPKVIKEQLPFTIKKSVPAKLRKDFWRALATVSFPSTRQGLDAFQQLREFRKRHLYEWGDEEFARLPKQERSRRLQDQKANTVADLAAVLGWQEQKSNEHEQLFDAEQAQGRGSLQKIDARMAELLKLKADTRKVYTASGIAEDKEEYKRHKKELMKLKQEVKALRPAVTAEVSVADVLNADSTGSLPKTVLVGGIRRTPKYTMDGVKIEWVDIATAEYAETWPAGVVHDVMPLGGARERHISAVGLAETPSQWKDVPARRETNANQLPSEKTTMQRVVDRLRFGRQRS